MSQAILTIGKGARLSGVKVVGMQVLVESDEVITDTGEVHGLLQRAGVWMQNCSFVDCLWGTTAMYAEVHTGLAIARAAGKAFVNPHAEKPVAQAIQLLLKPRQP